MGRFLRLGPKNEKGPNGLRICKMCEKECPTNRHYYCSDICRDDYYCRCSSSGARAMVYRRDKGMCQKCGLDCDRLQQHLAKLQYRANDRYHRLKRGLKRRGFKDNSSLWEADHIIPVIEGGDGGVDNLQTLCVPCHKEETKKLAKRRAMERKFELDGIQDESNLIIFDSNIQNLNDSFERESKPFFPVMPTKISI